MPVPSAPLARHLGDLTRNETRWGVYLETRHQRESWAGRIHFVDGTRHRSSGWIFVEWTESALLDRFNEFSPVELWRLVESLG
ncbi:MAG: hypothetical protein ACHQXA_04570 [Gemmatimonadales bacterium]